MPMCCPQNQDPSIPSKTDESLKIYYLIFVLCAYPIQIPYPMPKFSPKKEISLCPFRPVTIPPSVSLMPPSLSLITFPIQEQGMVYNS